MAEVILEDGDMEFRWILATRSTMRRGVVFALGSKEGSVVGALSTEELGRWSRPLSELILEDELVEVIIIGWLVMTLDALSHDEIVGLASHKDTAVVVLTNKVVGKFSMLFLVLIVEDGFVKLVVVGFNLTIVDVEDVAATEDEVSAVLFTLREPDWHM